MLLGASVLALALAPAVLDDSYSWVEHTTSQAGGQGVDGGWMARLGFVLFGLAVIWLVRRQARDPSRAWSQPATALDIVFGTYLFAVAAFRLRSWQAGAPFDRTEDIALGRGDGHGFAYALGVTAARWWPVDSPASGAGRGGDRRVGRDLPRAFSLARLHRLTWVFPVERVTESNQRSQLGN